VAPANFLDWRERARSFEGLAAYEMVGRLLVGRESAQKLDVAIVSGNFFDVFRTHASQGATFGAQAPVEREILLADALWQSRFGGERDVVGRELQLDQELVRVVGVMPAGFDFPRGAELWLRAKDDLPELPIAMGGDLRALRDTRYLGVVGRLRDGARLAGAQAEMDHVAAALAREYPDANSGNGARVEPLFEALRGGGALAAPAAARRGRLRAADRLRQRREPAAGARRRSRTGARGPRGAWREPRTPRAPAGDGGSGGGQCRLSRGPRARLGEPPADDVALARRAAGARGTAPLGIVLALSVFLTLAAVVLVSLAPARVAAQTDALAGLRASGRTPLASPGATRLRGLIVIGEVALAVVLVNAAGLLLGTLLHLQRAPLGFEAAGALTARLDFPMAMRRDQDALRRFAQALEERLRAQPGVTAAAVGQALPLTGSRTSAGLRVEGREAAPNERLDTCWRLVSRGWHDALGVPLLRGRGFEERDTRDAPPVALVNATLVRLVFGSEDPIGRRIATGLDGPEGSWVSIIGVVSDTPQENVAKAAQPELYRPLAQDVRMGPSGLALVVRATGDPQRFGPTLRREVAAVRSDVGISQIRPLAGVARETLAGPRAASRVLLLFGALALFLAALGLYGVVACVVGELTRELGVRLALGARPAALVAFVLRRALGLALAGLALGVALALASGRLLEGALYGVTPRDPATLAGVALVLLFAAAAAGYGPARRASRLDPARVLRAD
jgi:hypothetical protein